MIAVVLAAGLLGAPHADFDLVESSSCSLAEIDAIVAGRDVLPSLAVVQAAVRAELGATDGDPGWMARARWRGLVPRVDVSLGTDTDQDVRDTSSARTTVEGRALGLRVAARFDLGDLVFADAELRSSRERAARDDAVQDRLAQVTHLYFERVELLIAARASASVPVLLRARAVDGLITALTGGRVPFPTKQP